MKRNRERMKTFLEIKKKELSGILEDEAKKLDANEVCTAKGITEAVVTNYIGALNDAKVGEKEPSKMFKLKQIHRA